MRRSLAGALLLATAVAFCARALVYVFLASACEF